MAMNELQHFIESGEVGMETDTSSDTLQRAAEKMFTSKGLLCPVTIMKRSGKTYVIRRDAISRRS
jgi:hypothetical protein